MTLKPPNASNPSLLSLQTTAAQTILSRFNVSAPASIAFNADGNLVGTDNSNSPYRVGFAVGTSAGSNGTRGDAITLDTANGANATFFAPFYQNAQGSAAFDDKGSFTQYTGYLTVSEYSGGGSVYAEGFTFYGGVTTDRQGALTGGIEVQNVVNSGKQARASAANLILSEANTPPTWTGFSRTAAGSFTTAVFGASSEWLKGSRVVDIVSNGASAAPVGINFRGSFTKAILLESSDGLTGFAVSGSAFVDVMRSSSAATAFRTFDSSISKTQEMLLVRTDGKLLWGPGSGVADAALERSGAAVLTATGTVRCTVGVGTRHEAAATPTGGASGDIRVGTGKIWVNDAGTWKSAVVA